MGKFQDDLAALRADVGDEIALQVMVQLFGAAEVLDAIGEKKNTWHKAYSRSPRQLAAVRSWTLKCCQRFDTFAIVRRSPGRAHGRRRDSSRHGRQP